MRGPAVVAAGVSRYSDMPFEDLWIYSDEVYSGLVYDGEFQSIAAVPGMQERTIIADSCSKTWAMTGWRIGFAANARLAPSFTRWVTNTDSCPAHPNQYAALEAVSGPQQPAEEMRSVFLKRRDRIVNGLNAIEGFRCLSPGGAFYVWPNVSEACRMVGAANSEEFRLGLLHKAGVAVLADVHFGTPVEGDGEHIRFSYASSFEAIDDGSRLIVAPEGLSRFYIEQPGRHRPDSLVGATWMTSHDREREIEDYVGYLDAVADLVFETVERRAVGLTVLGFSQGLHTAIRWSVLGRWSPDRLILWGEYLPQDLNLERTRRALEGVALALVSGDADPSRQPEFERRQEKQLASLGLSHTTHSHSGGHEIDVQLLQELAWTLPMSGC